MIPNQLYLQCFVAGLLGILFHVFVVKLPSVKARAKAANVEFSIKSYFQDDWVALGAALITVLIAVFALDELLGYRPNVLKYIKYLFFFVGFTGSSLLIALLGKTTKAINDIVDVKTDIADGKK